MIHTNHWIKLISKSEKNSRESIKRFNLIRNKIKKIKPNTLKQIKQVLDQKNVISNSKYGITMWQLLIDMKNKEIICIFKNRKLKLHKIFGY